MEEEEGGRNTQPHNQKKKSFLIGTLSSAVGTGMEEVLLIFLLNVKKKTTAAHLIHIIYKKTIQMMLDHIFKWRVVCVCCAWFGCNSLEKH